MNFEKDAVDAAKTISTSTVEFVELQDVALALVGGGSGEVIFPN